MNLPTRTYLFKERYINAHGMSISWRHKLSPLEENLSNFLYVTDLNDSIQTSHLCYSDNVFTSNKLDFELYKNISLIQEFTYNKVSLISNELNYIMENYPELKINKREKMYILKKYKKYENIKKSAINPLVIILMKRYHIFELEKRLRIVQGLHKDKDLLKSNMDIKHYIDKLINFDKNQQNIINILNSNIQDLEKNILILEEKIKERRADLDIHKEINKNNKIIRKSKLSTAKTKKQKKKIRKIFISNHNIAE